MTRLRLPALVAATTWQIMAGGFDLDQGAAAAIRHRGGEGDASMPEAKDLAANFRLVKLVLARSSEHPYGESDEGYDVLVPLHDDGTLDADTWRQNPETCRIRRFTAAEPARLGHVRRKPGGRWYFDYQEGDEDDEIGFRFGAERFVPGEYVSISHQGVMRTYLVAHVRKP
jgi:hypothetical protein